MKPQDASSPSAELNGLPLDQIDMSQAWLYQRAAHEPLFKRLREEAPIHYCAKSEFGPYWSLTRYREIERVEMDHHRFSSDRDVTIGDQHEDFLPINFIAADPPRHTAERAVVEPRVRPNSLKSLRPRISDAIDDILDGLPDGEQFNWVEHVSKPLTSTTLALLFDIPLKDMALLPYWSDVITSTEILGKSGIDEKQRQQVMLECLAYFTALWKERAENPKGEDFITLLARNPATADMVDDPMWLMGMLLLLIVGGNDTTRNSISGGIVAINSAPGEWQKLVDGTAKISNAIQEIIRWQTPLAHMRRTATVDYEIGDQLIKAGDKVVIWYISGNRDETVFEDASTFDVTRRNARRHLSFGRGIHHCMGSRVADLQLTLLWEGLLNRFKPIELVGTPARVQSNFVMGDDDVPVMIRRR